MKTVQDSEFHDPNIVQLSVKITPGISVRLNRYSKKNSMKAGFGIKKYRRCSIWTCSECLKGALLRKMENIGKSSDFALFDVRLVDRVGWKRVNTGLKSFEMLT